MEDAAMETEWLWRTLPSDLFVHPSSAGPEHTEKEDAVDFFRLHSMEVMATDGWENPAQDMTIGRVKPTNSAEPIVYICLFKNVMTKETSEHKILYQ